MPQSRKPNPHEPHPLPRPQAMKPKCPQCGSTRIASDGDAVFEEPDLEYVGYYGWWECEECGHQWRYQDDSLNPGGKEATP